jgi:murein DD-endopeptidase MepM/ murein hydrolase activator NlpD
MVPRQTVRVLATIAVTASAAAALVFGAPAMAGARPAAAQPCPAEPGTIRGAREWGRTYTQWFYDGRSACLWSRFSADLRAALTSPTRLDELRNRLIDEAGPERQVVEEDVTPWLGSTIYTRTARFSRRRDTVRLQWTVTDAGLVRAFTVRPAVAPAPSRHLDYETRTPLRLPVEGDWFVYWGGRAVPDNYHAASDDQRFAADLLVVRDGATHRGDGADNQDYFCFGQPVVAPAAGRVVAAVDEVADNRPGTLNEQQPLGNHVVLDHGHGEYSFLAHLQEGSVSVAPGERVAAGDRVGRCGNSGRSSEPHLHHHLQTTPVPFDGAGLPAEFERYCANGEFVAEGELQRGQTVAPAHGGGCPR